MRAFAWRSSAGASLARIIAAAAITAAAALLSAAQAPAQSVLDRSPNLTGTWTGSPGVAYFNFSHRFRATSGPAHKVLNTPTFLLAAGLPGSVLVGARYASNSLLVSGFPNEWELFTSYSPLRQSAGLPADVAITGAYNQAAGSFDGQVTVARRIGPLRLLGAARGFTSTFGQSARRAALAGGATFRVTEGIALAADYATLLDAAEDENAAWSAGVQIQIPTTPHTLSLHASNTNTTTLQGGSVGTDVTLWGFEFTVPITLSRYFGGGGPPEPPPAPDAEGDAVADAAPGDRPADGARTIEVTMTDRLTYDAESVRVRVGDTVRWINTSRIVHTVTADPARALNAGSVRLPEGASPFDSGNMNPGANFSYTFQVPGTYVYFCVPHEAAGMIGTVVVEPASS